MSQGVGGKKGRISSLKSRIACYGEKRCSDMGCNVSKDVKVEDQGAQGPPTENGKSILSRLSLRS